ncbi:WD40-repeat-containing domain protein [Tribonema minus]|uniref:WD40-repeat-containing domain protein n=1 Tax=Tribonema minus TaxID=303371 RepID=A0A835ZG42_9STRA|nr:WD40-repeat-containing domain protein [Tribonema minus]
MLLNMKRTFEMFVDREGNPPPEFEPSQKVKIATRMAAEYAAVREPPTTMPVASTAAAAGGGDKDVTRIVSRLDEEKRAKEYAAAAAASGSASLVLYAPSTEAAGGGGATAGAGGALVVARRQGPSVPKPTWHAPWKLQSVVSGHLGWVRAIAFDPGNEWFATGSADRTIKVWDLAKCAAGAEGGLKLTLTGHINCIRGLAVSPRHPYMFSAGEDKKVLCWDLECNKVIRHYHGHLSGIYALALHPTLDILITAGRDSVARVWDMRSKQQIHVLAGHTNAVGSLLTNAADPQVITGSHDCTIKLWDLVAGKSFTTLTHHKKAVRALAAGKREFSFVSAAADNMKRWQARDGMFLNNMRGHNAIINTLSSNEDNVLFSGGDNGSITFWDYDTGYPFQKMTSGVQPGSLDAEAGIFCSSFDASGSRLVTGEADKSIKIWREDLEATPETHPIDMKQWAKDYTARRR